MTNSFKSILLRDFDAGVPTILCYPDIVEASEFLTQLFGDRFNIIVLLKNKWMSSVSWQRANAAIIFDSLPNADTLTLMMHGLCREAQLLARPIDELFVFGEHSIDILAQLSHVFQKDPWFARVAPLFRDKLSMRRAAASCGIDGPNFAAGNDSEGLALLRAAGVHGMRWLSKPRTGMGSQGLHIWSSFAELDTWLESLTPENSRHFIIEEFVPGNLYHVDGIVHNLKVLSACAFRYGSPIADVVYKDGFVTDVTLSPLDALAVRLREEHDRVVASFGLRLGVTHIEFFHDPLTDRISLCEAACRPPGLGVVDLPRIIFGESMLECLAKSLLGTFSVRSVRGASGMISFTAPKGRVLSYTSIDELQHPDIITRNPEVFCQSPDAQRDILNHLGQVFFHSPNTEACVQAINETLKQFSVTVEKIS